MIRKLITAIKVKTNYKAKPIKIWSSKDKMQMSGPINGKYDKTERLLEYK